MALTALTVALLAGCAARRAALDPGLLLERTRARLRLLEASIAQEDAPRPERSKAHTVAEQVAAELAAARAAATGDLARAVAALERAYLASDLDSTYAPLQPGPWAPDDGRDTLGSATCDARLRAWQPADDAHAFIKFAVPPPTPGAAPVVRVGQYRTRHVDIAGGPAIAAGVLRVRFPPGQRPQVIAIENASSGLRPGRLRTATGVAAIRAAGYAAPDLTIYNDPSGDYDRSRLAPLNMNPEIACVDPKAGHVAGSAPSGAGNGFRARVTRWPDRAASAR